MWDSLQDSLGDSKIEFNSTWHWGSIDIYWIAFYKFGEYIGVEYKQKDIDKLNLSLELAKECFWWYPFENYCIVSEKPIQINWDEARTVLNSLDNMSIEFADGYGIYSVDGIMVKKELIENKKDITILDIDQEENSETRRIKIKLYENINGRNSYIKNSDSKLIEKNELGELYKRNLRNDEPIVSIKVFNSTYNENGKQDEYWLRVPPAIKSVKEAVAWTFGMTEKEYKPEIEM